MPNAECRVPGAGCASTLLGRERVDSRRVRRAFRSAAIRVLPLETMSPSGILSANLSWTERRSQSSVAVGRRPASSNLGARLHRSNGLITKRNMSGLGGLPVMPVPAFDAVRIRALRERLNLSQAVLARVLNTSASTVRKWELGDKSPSGPSLKLLDLLERKGLPAVL